MQKNEPCKIELKWPACCPRCGLDLRVSPEISPKKESMEPVSPATIVLKETAKQLAQQTAPQEKPTDVEEQIDLAIIVSSQTQRPTEDVAVASQTVKPITLPLTGRIEIASKGDAKILPMAVVPVPPPLPMEEIKQETPPPPPPCRAPEPEVVMSRQEPTQTMIPPRPGQSMPPQRIDQLYGLFPTPNQSTFPPQPQPMPNPAQFGQFALNPPPTVVSQQQQQFLTSQPPLQQVPIGPSYQTAWYRPPPPTVLIQQHQQQPQPVTPQFVQFSAPPAPVNFPFPPPFLQQQQQLQSLPPGQVPMVPGNGVFTVQHHYLNVLPGQFQQ